LNPANWTDVTNSVNSASGTNQVLITPTGSGDFYRLIYP